MHENRQVSEQTESFSENLSTENPTELQIVTLANQGLKVYRTAIEVGKSQNYVRKIYRQYGYSTKKEPKIEQDLSKDAEDKIRELYYGTKKISRGKLHEHLEDMGVKAPPKKIKEFIKKEGPRPHNISPFSNDTILRITEMRLAGMKYRIIAQTLTEEGIEINRSQVQHLFYKSQKPQK